MSDEFQLNGNTYQAKRFALREWLKFSEIQEKIIDAAEEKDAEKMADSLCLFLSAAVGVDARDFPWYEVAEGYAIYTNLNRINERFPVLREMKKKFKEAVPWEYEGRTFYWWVHVLGQHYGWSIEYISALDMDDAIALLQEIMTDQQLEREWEWSLTEIAYPYNESTKKSEFKPLPRPEWMVVPAMVTKPKIPKIRIPIDMMPKGIVLSYNPDEPIIN